MLKKQLLPIAVRCASLPVINRIPMQIENLGAALQSKRGGGFDSEWQEVTNAIHFISRNDPLIFDIGTNHGHWTSAMLKRVGGKIIMFEPQLSCWPILNTLVDNRVSLEKFAISSQVGMISFYQTDNSEIAGTYARSDFQDNFNIIEVPCSTLDNYIKRRSIDFVDFIKMDIEGHEMDALKGAEESLKSNRIGAISFEFGCANVNSRTFFIDYYDFLSDLGYSIYRVAHDGIPVALRSYSRSCEYFSGVANYIASIKLPKKHRK